MDDGWVDGCFALEPVLGLFQFIAASVPCANAQTNERSNEATNERTNERSNEATKQRSNEATKQRTNEVGWGGVDQTIRSDSLRHSHSA